MCIHILDNVSLRHIIKEIYYDNIIYLEHLVNSSFRYLYLVHFSLFGKSYLHVDF